MELIEFYEIMEEKINIGLKVINNDGEEQRCFLLHVDDGKLKSGYIDGLPVVESRILNAFGNLELECNGTGFKLSRRVKRSKATIGVDFYWMDINGERYLTIRKNPCEDYTLVKA